MTSEFQPYNLDLHGVRLPSINISKEDKSLVGLDEKADNLTYLSHLCNKGFENKVLNKKIDPQKSREYADRCKLELETFKKLNLVDYVLLVYDILSWCDKQNIPKGPGRGSASGSLTLFLIGCTQIDPIKHQLYFTRFISEARAQSKIVDNITYLSGKTLMDVDSDISYYRRDEVIKYIEETYKGRTSKIGTQSCLTGKLLVKEASKTVLEYSEQEAKYLSDLIEKRFGVVSSLEETYKENTDFKKWVDSTPQNTECFKIACSLQNLIKHKSCHPSGMTVSFDIIEDILPLELSSSKDKITSYNMEEVANIAVKLDILGLKTIDIINETCLALQIKPYDIDINHSSIYQFLKTRNEYYGLFQIEEGLSKKVILDVKPQNIDHLSACIAISRPGAFSYIKDYVKFVNEGFIEKFHPVFDKVLANTGNIILYQEQITKICEEIYKMDGISSDQVRYCIGKKKVEEIKKWEQIIKERGEEINIPEEITEKFWDTVNRSADYLFCYNHSLSYSYITAITTYLKTNYPKEFFLSLLKMSKYEPSSIEVIGKINQELKSFGISLLPPNILWSDIDFKIVGNDILFGLGSIKGISDKTIEKLNKFRHPHSNKFEIFMGAKEAGLPINVLNALILTGCLGLKKRTKLVYEAQLFNLLLPKEKQWVLECGQKFDYNLVDCLKHIKTLNNEKGKPLIKESRYNTLKKYEAPFKQMYEINSKYERLTNWWFESKLLGYAYSTNLMDIYKESAPDLMSIEEINSSLNREKVHFVGEVVNVINRKGKNTGFKYLKIEVRDHTGSCQVILADSEKRWKVQEHKEDNGRLVKEEDVIVVKGSKGDNIVFGDCVGIQACEILDKINKLKNIGNIDEDEKIVENLSNII